MGFGESMSSAKARERQLLEGQRVVTLQRYAGIAPTVMAVVYGDYVTGLEWKKNGLCQRVDPESLFVQGASQQEAKRICSGCPVIQECREYALDESNGIEHGVWGGMTERELHAEKRQRSA